MSFFSLPRVFARTFASATEPGHRSRMLPKRRERRAVVRSFAAEHLEPRALLAIVANAIAPSGSITQGWVSLTATDGDDVYVSQISPAVPGQSAFNPALLYSNNASFLNAQEIPDISSIATVLIANGSAVSSGSLTGTTYPFVANGNGSASSTTVFSLRDEVSRVTSTVSGVIKNGVGGEWSFVRPISLNGQLVQFTITPVLAVGPTPRSMFLNDGTSYVDVLDAGFVSVTWDTDVVGAAGLSAASPPTLDIAYRSGNVGLTQQSGIRASADTTVRFALPAPAGVAEDQAFRIAPGTLRGTIASGDGDFSYEFTTSSATSEDLVFLTAGGYSDEAFFLDSVQSRGGVYSGRVVYNNFGRPEIEVSFTDADSRSDLTRPRYTGPVNLVADYSVIDRAGSDGAISDCFFVAGLNFDRELFVDMGQPGATIRIDSSLLGVGTLDLRASNVVLNAAVSSDSSFTVGKSASGALCEQLFFNASMAAQAFDLRLGDDPSTGEISRSKMFISPSGSLGGGGLDSANTLFVQVADGDIFIEGTVSATNQTWLMQSALEEDLANISVDPYVMSTTAVISGVATGLLRGSNVAITLGNDLPSLYDYTDIGGSTALSVVTLRTDIDSLRITAADRKGTALATPFPYDVLISEDGNEGDGNISIDAVAASSRAIEIFATNDIAFNASLASASDVVVSSQSGKISLLAPLSTAFGAIEISADSLTIGNSVRVLDSTYDVELNDITLIARQGDMILNGPISAVNGIKLIQSGIGNVIRGPSRLIADRLSIEAEGSADLTTSVREVSGIVGGGITINEADGLLVSDLSAGDKKVSITVGGEDYFLLNADGLPDFGAGRRAALQANLNDVNELVVSAPQGSIDVIVNATKDIVLGNIATIQTRAAASMVAAGSVRIQTSAAGIIAYDAPVAGGNAKKVAVASTASVAGTFVPRFPGTLSATLQSVDFGMLSSLASSLDGVSNLKVGDLLLLKDQSLKQENGIYRVISLGSATSRWTLARASDFDTSAEAKLNSWVRPLRGQTQAQKLYRIAAFGQGDDFDELMTTPRRVTAVTNTGAAYAVRAVSSGVLNSQYAPDDGGVYTLTASAEGLIPRFDGVSVNAGDTVFVRQGNVKDGVVETQSIGVYSVVDAGDATRPWRLQRVPDFQLGRVVANEGSLRAAKTGLAYEISFDSLNNLTMDVEAVGDDDVFQEIGSQDINDTVKFVVSTNLGTSDSTGSLGKMLELVQTNSFDVPDPQNEGAFVPQRQSLAFASSIGGTIQLTQSLPAIRQRLTIDAAAPRVEVSGLGSSAIVIDGSRISRKSDSTIVAAGEEINGFEFIGTNASGSVLNNIVLAGFTRGAAVSVDNASDMLISNLKIGENAAGVKLANKQGINLRNGVGGFTTILNNSVRACNESAIQVGSSVGSSVRIIGNSIGALGSENKWGIKLDNGTNFIGSASVDVTLKRLSVVKVQNSANKFTLPAGFAQLPQLRVGLGVLSARITPPAGNPSATITSISAPDAKKAVTVTIDGTIEGTAAAMVIDIGVFVRPEQDDPRRFQLPACVDLADVFLGQSISGPNVAAGTTISALDTSGPTTTVTLSKAFLRTEAQAVVFGPGGRNQVSFNNYGIIQSAGTSRIYNTTIASSVFDGIRIDGGFSTIGLGSAKRQGVDGRSPSKDRDPAGQNNYIFGSGNAGIRLANLPPANVEIQGNYFAVTNTGSANPNKAGNIIGPQNILNIVDRLKTGSVTEVSADGRLITVSLADHGLADGAFVWLKIGSNSVGNSYRVTRLSANTFKGELAGVTTVTTKPQVSNAVNVSLYGATKRSAELAGTGSVDFEGNQHGLAVAFLSVGTGAASPSTGTGAGGGVTTGRPIIRPVVRPRR